jgi:hypothetical protein
MKAWKSGIALNVKNIVFLIGKASNIRNEKNLLGIFEG